MYHDPLPVRRPRTTLLFSAPRADITIYCGNYHCPISTDVAKELISLGFINVYDYKGGLKEWQEMGYVTTAGSG